MVGTRCVRGSGSATSGGVCPTSRAAVARWFTASLREVVLDLTGDLLVLPTAPLRSHS
jgi:hypothetical protein